MSRQIKFRVYDAYLNKMHEHDSIYNNSVIAAYIMGKNERDREHCEKYYSPPMQFTGLQDILKTDIYHKDIVEVDGEIGVVEWNESGAYWCVVFDEHSSEYLHWAIDATRIIGNAYEHPEFLIKQS